MSNRSTDIMDFGQQPRRRNRAATGEAALHEMRQRAALTERRLPDATEGRHAVSVSKAPALLTEDQRRQRASYTLPAAEMKRRTVEKLRSEIEPAIASLAATHRLTLLAARTVQVVYNRQKAAGGGWTTLSPANVADILNAAPDQGPNKITADQLRDLIESLIKLGVIERRAGATFNIGSGGAQPTYKVNV
jgi:hypothetical protein